MSQNLSSQPAITLQQALHGPPAELLESLKLYNETHEVPSDEDVEVVTADPKAVEQLLDVLHLNVASKPQAFVQALQVVVTLVSDDRCMATLLERGILTTLHGMLPELSQEGRLDEYYNYLFAVQCFCEKPASKKQAGELFLLDFCRAARQPFPTNIRRSLLGCINALLQASSENKALLEKAKVPLAEFVAALKTCGDHYLQQQVVEFLFRSKRLLEGKEQELFENNAEVAAAFSEIKGKGQFNDHLRSFLLVFNRAQGAAQNVFSVKAVQVLVGEAHEQAETWVDFGAEHVTFEIRGEEEPTQYDLPYRDIRHLKITDRTKAMRQVRIKLKTTPEVLKDMYDSEKDDWISFGLAADDLALFTARIAPVVVAVQKKSRAAERPGANKPGTDHTKSVPAPAPAPQSPKPAAKIKAASPHHGAATAPVSVDEDGDSDPEQDRRVTRSQSQQPQLPRSEAARLGADKKPKPAPRRESDGRPAPSRKRRLSDTFDMLEPAPKQPAVAPRESPAAKPPRRSAASAHSTAVRATLDLGDALPPPPAPRRASASAAAAARLAAFDADDDAADLKLDFPALLSQGDGGLNDDGDLDDEGSLTALQKQFEALVAKQRDATRKKGTSKINETMAVVQRRLDAFKADATRRREELQSEAGDRLAKMQQELAETKKSINQMVARFQAEVKENLGSLQAISDQVAQLAHVYEAELPRQLKVDEDQALRELKAEVEGEVHRLDKQLQSAAKDTKTIKMLGQFLSKALAD